MSSTHTKLEIIAVIALVGSSLFRPTPCGAQGGNAPSSNTLTQMDAMNARREMTEKELSETQGDPKEIQAYNAFHNASEPAKKIKLGLAFLGKYPSDHYSETVYQELTQTYYAKQDLPDFYSYSEKGLAVFPDDVPLLAMEGWVIPRAYDHNNPDADKSLDKAEGYEKHAIDAVGKLQKPMGISEQQFSAYTNSELFVAHSGLGLVYFRQEHYEKSIPELQKAIDGNANPDPTDLFVLGADFENLGRYKDAVDTFNRCAAMTGTLQDRCKQAADGASKQAAQAK
jgi:tetratricopeptide (TPR) repeat protein